ncbi:hypothetical protein [Kibdelosporangium phytohabitans]|nr:hypothetical protein [Kibdelosporangium phytohabitans]MBE1470266.1 hypothetical protein [Kibdelosporangium phytohabitans]
MWDDRVGRVRESGRICPRRRFLGFIALIGLNATLGLFDSFSRGQAT